MGQDNFGLKIGVEGEREFKQTLADINQSFKVLGSEMALDTSQFEKNDKSIQAVTSRNAVLNKEIDAQKEKISTLKAALDNAASSFGENDRRTQNWQIQLNKAQAELNGMERELDESAEGADDLGKQITDSGENAEKAGGKFEKLGSILSGIGKAMGTVAAAAGAAAIKLGKEVVQQFGELEQNLALLLAQLPADVEAALRAPLFAAYRAGNPRTTLDDIQLSRRVNDTRRRRLVDYLRKCVRDCGRIRIERNRGAFIAMVRDEADFLEPIVADPDRWLASGSPLKQGNTATLALIEHEGRKLVIKRYNIKGAAHALSRCWRPSRAACSRFFRRASSDLSRRPSSR